MSACTAPFPLRLDPSAPMTDVRRVYRMSDGSTATYTDDEAVAARRPQCDAPAKRLIGARDDGDVVAPMFACARCGRSWTDV